MNSAKEQFIEKLQHERDKFELLLNRVGYTRRMTLKGVAGKWSIKDMLASILSHEQFIADRMEEIVNHETYTPCKTQTALDAFLNQFGYPDFDSPLLVEDMPNEWVITRYKNVSLDDVIAQELQAFAVIIASLEKLTEQSIHRHNLDEQIARHTYQHYRRHASQIKHWLGTNGVKIK